MKRFNAFHEGFIAPAIFIHLTSHWPATLCRSRCDWLDIQQREIPASQVLEPIGMAEIMLPTPQPSMAATSNQSLVQKHGRAQFFLFFFMFRRSPMCWDGNSFRSISDLPGHVVSKRLAALCRFSRHGRYTLQREASRTGLENCKKWGFAREKIIGTFRKVW